MRHYLLSIIAGLAGFGLTRWIINKPAPPTENVRTSAPAAPVSSTAPGPASASPEASTLDSAKSPRERLRKALADGDVFCAASDAAAWLKTASVEDFRAFAKDPKKFPRLYFAGFDDDFKKAFLEAFAERWLTPAPGDLTLMDKVTGEERGEMLVAAARAKPELVLAQLSPDGKTTSFDSVAFAAFESLAGRDLRTTRQFLELVPDLKKRREYEYAMISGLATSDVFAAAAQLPKSEAKPGLPDYVRDRTIAAIVEAAERASSGALRRIMADAQGEFDQYPGLPRLLLRYPDLAEDLAARGAGGDTHAKGYALDAHLLHDVDGATPEARAKLLASYDTLPAAGRDQLCAALAVSLARTDPRAAAEWATTHAKADDAASPANAAAQYVLICWANSDPAAAAAWWQSLPPSPMRDVIGMEASTYYAEASDFDTALKMFHPVPGQEHEMATQHLALLYAKEDPIAAANWLASLPAGIPDSRTISSVVERFYNRDTEGAARWVESLPAGTLRDQAVKSFAIRSAPSDPAAAAEWLGKIGDAKLRLNTAKSIAFPWRADNPAAAREWVRNLPGVDESWRASFLKP